MSRWIPEHALSCWLLWADADHLRVLRRSAWRRGAPYVEHDRIALNIASSSASIDDAAAPAATAYAAALLAACQAACRQLQRRFPLQVTLALPQSLTPALPVEFAAAKLSAQVRQAYLNARFQQAFGPEALGWRIQCDGRVHEGRALAFACSETLISALCALRVGVVRLHVVPGVTWGARRALHALHPAKPSANVPAFQGWYVHREADRDVALWLANGRASQIALLPQGAGYASALSLRERLQAWGRRCALPDDAGTLLIASLDTQARDIDGESAQTAMRLGLFGDLDARPAG